MLLHHWSSALVVLTTFVPTLTEDLTPGNVA